MLQNSTKDWNHFSTEKLHRRTKTTIKFSTRKQLYGKYAKCERSGMQVANWAYNALSNLLPQIKETTSLNIKNPSRIVRFLESLCVCFKIIHVSSSYSIFCLVCRHLMLRYTLSFTFEPSPCHTSAPLLNRLVYCLHMWWHQTGNCLPPFSPHNPNNVWANHLPHTK